jgi:hypothetical protein
MHPVAAIETRFFPKRRWGRRNSAGPMTANNPMGTNPMADRCLAGNFGFLTFSQTFDKQLANAVSANRSYGDRASHRIFSPRLTEIEKRRFHVVRAGVNVKF